MSLLSDLSKHSTFQVFKVSFWEPLKPKRIYWSINVCVTSKLRASGKFIDLILSNNSVKCKCIAKNYAVVSYEMVWSKINSWSEKYGGTIWDTY